MGVGDLLENFLSFFGITENRVNRLLAWLHFRPCFCGTIKRWLNRRKWLHKVFSWAGFKVRYDDGEIW